jgi:maleate isomerase
VPWANTAVEEELPLWAERGVVYHYARLVPPGRLTTLDDGFLRGLAAAVPDAAGQLARLPLAGVLLACTSVGFSGLTADLPPVVSAFDALVDLLRRRRARRIVLATPYPEPLTRREAAAFTRVGVDVLANVSLGRDDELDRTTPTDILDLIADLGADAVRDADMIVLSCTAWRTAGLLPRIEGDLGRPVVSSNLALARYAAGLAGPGYP